MTAKVGFSRRDDRTVLECIDFFWHEVSYAMYVADHLPNAAPVEVKVGDKNTGKACRTPATEHLPGPGGELGDSPNRGLKRRENVVVQECINNTWHNLTFAVFERWDDKDEPDPTIPPIRVKIGDEDTELPCTAITPQPQPPGTGGAGTPTGTSTLGSSHARSECGDDGFWHVITDEDWIRPDGTHFKRKDDKKTAQKCKPGDPIPSDLPGGTQPPDACPGRVRIEDKEVKECINGTYWYRKYAQYRCADGSTWVDSGPDKWLSQTTKGERCPENTGAQDKQASLIGIVLPSDSRAGDHISGTVVADPKRYEKNLALRVVELQVPLAHDAAGQPVLAGATIDLGDGRRQPADRPLSVTVPGGASSLSVTTWDGLQKTGEARVPLTPASTPVAQPTDFTAQPTCTTGTVQTVRGPFAGDARNTQITVDDKPATVLAETPRAAYWELPGQTTAGRHVVHITDNGHTVTVPVSVLSLVMTADRTTLMRGESTPFSATVAGLDTVPDSAWQHTQVPDGLDLAALASDAPGFRAPQGGDAGVVLLTITNASRDTISIDKATNEVIVLTLDRNAVLKGKYVYQGTIRSKKSGGFRVDGLVVSFLAPVVAQPQAR